MLICLHILEVQFQVSHENLVSTMELWYLKMDTLFCWKSIHFLYTQSIVFYNIVSAIYCIVASQFLSLQLPEMPKYIMSIHKPRELNIEPCQKVVILSPLSSYFICSFDEMVGAMPKSSLEKKTLSHGTPRYGLILICCILICQNSLYVLMCHGSDFSVFKWH